MTVDNLDPIVQEEDLAETENLNYQEIIETVISSLEQNDSAMVNHGEQGTLWKFQYGSVEVFVQMTGTKNDDLLTVWSPILTLPAKNELELMKQLMAMNWSGTFETCFALLNDQVVVSHQRTIADLYPGEISRAITLVATIADDNDDRLQAEFGL
ncbi:YbjN domain-containing protein [Spirulina subsalsa]|uniref:YbjN domain-containing protein n=1 Tax=Spirulina subsalsa TaxID=54311 RepID=UPI00030AFB81|nr:YbjN domain-containing protein [Spirulina subsalsa]